MKHGIDSVTTVRLDSAAISALGMLLDNVAIIFVCGPWLDCLDCLCQTLSRCLNKSYRIRIRERLVADVICFVKITMVPAVVKGHVDVDDIAVLQYVVVGNTVADNFIDRGTD